MEIYKIGETDLRRLQEDEIETEAQLEEILVRSDGAQVGGVNVFYIDQQGTAVEQGRFDILGIDPEGRCVIIELKRSKAPRDIVAQALEYASGIRKESYDTLEQRYQDFEGVTTEEGNRLDKAHQRYFDLDDPLPESEFNSEQRIVVVGTEFREESLAMADFLRDNRIDVVVVEYSSYNTDNESEELLTTEPIKHPLQSHSGGGEQKPQPWKQNGREWHKSQTSERQWEQVTNIRETVGASHKNN
jgi:hypothetical protein